MKKKKKLEVHFWRPYFKRSIIFLTDYLKEGC